MRHAMGRVVGRLGCCKTGRAWYRWPAGWLTVEAVWLVLSELHGQGMSGPSVWDGKVEMGRVGCWREGNTGLYARGVAI